MKKLALVLGLLLVVTVGSVFKHQVSLKPATFKIGQERPWCTAFAISDTVAVTAAHCVVDDVTLTTDQITMFDQNDVAFGVGKMQLAKHPLMDLATVTGDFSNRRKLPVPTGRFELDPNDHYDSCGFPMMTKTLTCSHVKINSIFADGGFVGASGPGYMIFGMSGGPVFNTDKNVVVAVNTGLNGRELMFSPFIDIESQVAVPTPEMIMYKLLQGGISSVIHLDTIEQYK